MNKKEKCYFFSWNCGIKFIWHHCFQYNIQCKRRRREPKFSWNICYVAGHRPPIWNSKSVFHFTLRYDFCGRVFQISPKLITPFSFIKSISICILFLAFFYYFNICNNYFGAFSTPNKFFLFSLEKKNTFSRLIYDKSILSTNIKK